MNYQINNHKRKTELRISKDKISLDALNEPFNFIKDSNYPEYDIKNIYRPTLGLNGTLPKKFIDDIKTLSWLKVYAYDYDEMKKDNLNTSYSDTSFHAIGQLKNKEYFYFNALSDYTGFDCQGGMAIYTSKSYKDLIQYALPDDIYNVYIKTSTLKKSSKSKSPKSSSK